LGIRLNILILIKNHGKKNKRRPRTQSEFISYLEAHGVKVELTRSGKKYRLSLDGKVYFMVKHSEHWLDGYMRTTCRHLGIPCPN